MIHKIEFPQKFLPLRYIYKRHEKVLKAMNNCIVRKPISAISQRATVFNYALKILQRVTFFLSRFENSSARHFFFHALKILQCFIVLSFILLLQQ